MEPAKQPPCHFKVCLMDFECQELPVNDGSELFLQLDFAGQRAFRSDNEKAAPEIQWPLRAGFEYVASSLDNLSGQHLTVCCMTHDNRLVGEAAIDVETLARGPSSLKLTLKERQGSGTVGILKLSCIMRLRSPDLTVICTGLRLRGQDGAPLPGQLSISCSMEEAGGKATVLKLPHSEDGTWAGPCSLCFDTTLAELLRAPPCERLRFAIAEEEGGACVGEAFVAFRSAFSLTSNTAVRFRAPVTFDFAAEGGQGAEPGELEGTLHYHNVPTCAQLVGGTCVDGNIEGGYLLIEGLPAPRGMPNVEVWKDPSAQHHLGSVLCVSPQLVEELKASGVDVLRLDQALDQLELPMPWQMRRERSAGSTGRRYFADPRSCRTTWVDPRFLPDQWEQRIDPETGRVYFQYHLNKTTTFVDPRCCPVGWEMRVSKNNDAYFVHAASMQTTFTDPRGLPPRMEAWLDSQGRMFFKDHETKGTTWKDPRQGQSESVIAMWLQYEAVRWWYDQVLQCSDLGDARHGEAQRMDAA